MSSIRPLPLCMSVISFHLLLQFSCSYRLQRLQKRQYQSTDNLSPNQISSLLSALNRHELSLSELKRKQNKNKDFEEALGLEKEYTKAELKNAYKHLTMGVLIDGPIDSPSYT
ncbi:hypothetical protein LXL04_031016 [Taraxacum kok-saghyz]